MSNPSCTFAAVTQKSYKDVVAAPARVAGAPVVAAPVAASAPVAAPAPVATASSGAVQRRSNTLRSNPRTGEAIIYYIRMFAIQFAVSTFYKFFESLVVETVEKNLWLLIKHELPRYVEDAHKLKSKSTERIKLPEINEGQIEHLQNLFIRLSKEEFRELFESIVAIAIERKIWEKIESKLPAYVKKAYRLREESCEYTLISETFHVIRGGRK
jgi:hypothetical protein